MRILTTSPSPAFQGAMWPRLLAVRRYRAMECPRTLIAVHREDEQYEDAVRKLNGLQTNAAVLDLIRQQKGNRQVSEHNKMRQYLLRVGLTVGDLQQLKAIHVSGTKGKGSVCAITESILRCHGFKTGLYVSPHLLEVRERIRINGRPLSRKMFVSYFEEVYSKLHHTRHLYEDAMPSYFRFLTVMAFYVFLQSKVDVAVVEVGIGGTHDSTNIIEHPVVCGVTSLGYDHTDILGPTLADIAWHKGGICKEKCPVLTLNQSPEAMSALFHRARELRAQSFRVVPPLSSYPGPPPVLSLRGKHQTSNASLAVQLCHTWLDKHSPSSTLSHSVSWATGSDQAVPMAEPFRLTEQFQDGLRHCKWAGRNQVVERGNVVYYLDGAHTPESVVASAQWFHSEMQRGGGKPTVRVLLFNTTGSREAQTFLQPLMACGFSYAVFCPNIAHSTGSTLSNSVDQTNHTVSHDCQLSRCCANQQTFKTVLLSAGMTSEKRVNGDRLSEEETQTRVFLSVSDAVQFVESISPAHVAVLVTGSLHLVGTIMRVLNFTVDDV